jgi:hypothetical protein
VTEGTDATVKANRTQRAGEGAETRATDPWEWESDRKPQKITFWEPADPGRLPRQFAI